MNGRVYDPVVGRFMSPDDKAIVPVSSQHFNRYSYVLNNPLKYTDPSGWENIIYFVAAGNANKQQARSIANRTNEALKSNAINAEAKFKYKINVNKLDATDKIVIIGDNKKSVSNYVDTKLKSISDGTLNNWRDEDRTSPNPERSENPNAKEGGNKLIGLDMGTVSKTLGSEQNLIDNATFNVMHGLGHNAGIDHNPPTDSYSSNPRYMFMDETGTQGWTGKGIQNLLNGNSSFKEAKDNYVIKVNEQFSDSCPIDTQK